MDKKLEPPNFTQIPNIILGDIKPGNKVSPGLMQQLEGSELKVLLAVCRLTFGFHQNERRASLTMVANMTGLSRQGILNAAKKLEDDYGLIERKKDGGVTLWKAVVNSVDQVLCKPVVNSVDQVVNSVDQTSQLSLPPSKKETKKKPKKKNNGAKAHPIKNQDISLSVEAYRSIANRYPDKATWEMIENAVGTKEEDIEFWKEIITAYIACGWNKINIKGMLSFFERKRIPTTEPIKNGRNGVSQNGRGKVVEPTAEVIELGQHVKSFFESTC